MDLKLILSFIFIRKFFSQGKYVSWGAFYPIEQAQRFLSVLICFDISLPLLYSFTNSMNATTPQPQGHTEKMLNYEVSDLGIFSVHEQKS